MLCVVKTILKAILPTYAYDKLFMVAIFFTYWLFSSTLTLSSAEARFMPFFMLLCQKRI